MFGIFLELSASQDCRLHQYQGRRLVALPPEFGHCCALTRIGRRLVHRQKLETGTETKDLGKSNVVRLARDSSTIIILLARNTKDARSVDGPHEFEDVFADVARDSIRNNPHCALYQW